MLISHFPIDNYLDPADYDWLNFELQQYDLVSCVYFCRKFHNYRRQCISSIHARIPYASTLFYNYCSSIRLVLARAMYYRQSFEYGKTRKEEREYMYIYMCICFLLRNRTEVFIINLNKTIKIKHLFEKVY